MLPVEEGAGVGSQLVRKNKASIFAFPKVLAISLCGPCLVSQRFTALSVHSTVDVSWNQEVFQVWHF